MDSIVNVAKTLEEDNQKLVIVLDEVHKYNDISTMHRLLSQPNIHIVMVTATSPRVWKTFSQPQYACRWKEIDCTELSGEETILTSDSFAGAIDELEKRYGEECDIAPNDVKISKIEPNTVLKSKGRLFLNFTLDVSDYFENIPWVYGMSAKEAVKKNMSMPFNFRIVNCDVKTRLEDLIRCLCTVSSAKNALLLTLFAKDARKAEQILKQYDSPERPVHVKKLYGKYNERDVYDRLCKKNLESEDGKGLVVLISIKMLEVGADLPMVDTVVLDQNLNTQSNIEDCDKLLQLNRNTRLFIGKHSVETIMEDNSENMKALSHFIEKYDSNFEITSIYKTTFTEDNESDWFTNLVENYVPDAAIMKAIHDVIYKRQQTYLNLLGNVLDPFLSAFARKPPKKNDTFLVNGIELNATKCKNDIVACAKKRWSRDASIRDKIQPVIWLWEIVVRPQVPCHITFLGLISHPSFESLYLDYLKTASSDPIPANSVESLIDVVVPRGMTSNGKDIIKSLLDEDPIHKIKLGRSSYDQVIKSNEVQKCLNDMISSLEDPSIPYDTLVRDNYEDYEHLKYEDVLLKSTEGGIRENTNCFEMCKEIRDKIGLREIGHGSTPAVANKILLYQILKMPNYYYDHEWLKARKEEVDSFRTKQKNHKIIFDQRKSKQDKKRQLEESGVQSILKFLKGDKKSSDQSSL